MAILNYAKTYLEVLNNLNINKLLDLVEDTKGNYVKLFFVGEGDIISHGVNYTPLFNHPDAIITKRGLVPINTSIENRDKDFLRGDGSWKKITTADLPIWNIGDSYDTNTILNSLQVDQLVQLSFIANDAMRFKNVISSASDIESPWKVGDTYRVHVSGIVTIYEHQCQTGDLLICIKEGDDSVEYPKSYWAAVLTNINGTNTIKINNTPLTVYSDSILEDPVKIYTPTDNGYGKSLILIGANNTNGAPRWATLSGLSIIDIGNQPMLSLNKATEDNLGGVIIDNLGKTTDKATDGDTISINNDGHIYLTPTNIHNALGFMPTDPELLQDALTRANKEKDGLTPTFSSALGEFSDSSWVLGVHSTGVDSTYGWYSLPEKAFTWRKILIGGVDIEDSELHLNPSSDVCINFDADPTDNKALISFGLSWYNISANNGEGAYETA